jgi:ABC-type taurine transport system ATPase subunit
MVFQSYALFPFTSVAENVAYPLKIRGISPADQKRRAEAALEMVKLAGFDGLSLSECRALFRRLGRANIASLSMTGLDPTINGLSLVKTGQRLLLTER